MCDVAKNKKSSIKNRFGDGMDGDWSCVGDGTQREMRWVASGSLACRPFLMPSLPLPQDPERLCFLSLTLRPFHTLLGGLGKQEFWTSSERMQLQATRLDLRDLQQHLRFQVECPSTLLHLQRPTHKTKAHRLFFFFFVVFSFIFHWLPFKTLPLPRHRVSGRRCCVCVCVSVYV